MPLTKRRNLVMLFAVKLLVLGLFMPGCQEGTNKSPIAPLFIDSTLTGAHNNFADMEGANHKISGSVTSILTLEKLSDITVALYYEGTLAAVTRTTSNDGKFIFEGLPKGLFDVVIAPGNKIYEEERIVVRISTEGISPATINASLKTLPQN
jgi:hypothetical protein